MISQWAISGGISRVPSRPIRLCFACSKCAQQSYSHLQRFRRISSAATGERERPKKPKPRTSNVAKQIRRTGKLPALPNERIIKLPRLGSQRAPRDKNIVTEDLSATVDAHRAANLLSHGCIHIQLDEIDPGAAPKRLGVTTLKRVGGDTKQMSQDENKYVKGKAVLRPRKQRAKLKSNENDRKTHKSGTLNHKFKHLSRNCDSISRLNAEIRAFEQWMELSAEEEDAARKTFEHFKQSIGSLLDKRVRFELHGSRATGLARPTSDIDIRLYIPELDTKKDARGPSPGRPLIKSEYSRAFNRIIKVLQRDPNVYQYRIKERRTMARVPLLIVQNTMNHLCLEVGSTPITTSHTTEFTRYYQEEYPQIKPLFVLLRWWIEGIGYGEAGFGGVSSYLLHTLILTSIKHSKELYESQELGLQLVNFLQFWSTADIDRLGFAPDPSRTFPKFATNIIEDISAETHSLNSEAADLKSGITKGSKPFIAAAEETHDVDEMNKTHANSQDPSNYDMYLDGIKFLTKRAKHNQRLPKTNQTVLLLQDPADPFNNLGASARSFKRIQVEMKIILENLKTSMEAWDRQTQDHLHNGNMDPNADQQSYLLDTLINAYSSSQSETPTRRLYKFERDRLRASKADFSYTRSSRQDVTLHH